eukprot:6854907-Pyramimonas_sp.AAC.2
MIHIAGRLRPAVPLFPRPAAAPTQHARVAIVVYGRARGVGVSEGVQCRRVHSGLMVFVAAGRAMIAKAAAILE